MTQNCVSVVSSLEIIQNKNLGTVSHRKFFMKCWYNSKNLGEYCWSWFQTVLILPDQKNMYEKLI